jgi:hypothetical protein
MRSKVSPRSDRGLHIKVESVPRSKHTPSLI